MAANTGRTHSKWCTVKLDDPGGTLTDISAYVNTIGQVGVTYDTSDVTAFSNAVKNIVLGQGAAPITLGGPLDTVIITHIAAINGANTPLSMDIQFGIRQARQSGEPQFGITSSSTSGYLCTSFTTDGATWSATFDVYGGTTPAFGTSAET